MGPADGYPSSDKCNRRTSAQSSTLITPSLWPRGVKVHSAPEGQCSLGIDTSSGTCCSKLSRLFGHLFASAGRAAADAAEALGSGPFRSIGVTNAPTMRPHGPRTRKRLGARGVHRASDLRFSVSTRGAPERIRTFNLLIRSQMLYPLSYGRRSNETDDEDTGRAAVTQTGILPGAPAKATPYAPASGRRVAVGEPRTRDAGRLEHAGGRTARAPAMANGPGARRARAVLSGDGGI